AEARADQDWSAVQPLSAGALLAGSVPTVGMVLRRHLRSGRKQLSWRRPDLFGQIRRRAIFDSSGPRGRIVLQLARWGVLHGALDPAAAPDPQYQAKFPPFNRRPRDTQQPLKYDCRGADGPAFTVVHHRWGSRRVR